MNTRISLKSVAIVLMLSVTAYLTGCSSGAKIRSTYDDAADFSQYRTYNFFEDAGNDGANYQSLFTNFMIVAVSKEMEQRGYVQSSNPDLLVNFNATFQDKTKVTTSPSMHGGYYGYRGGYYGAWPAYGYGNDVNVSQYTEGTYNIDLVDAKRQQLVWEAVGVGRITEKKLDDLERLIKEGVPKYFENYPFRAGEGLPQPAPK